MVNLILSIVNAALACGLLAAILVNGRRTKKRFEDMTRYVNYCDSQLAKAMQELKEELFDAFTEETAKVKEELSGSFAKDRDELHARVSKLEKGITPDYEKAKVAANAVNDFNRGITAILGYDPAEAMKKSRDSERGGDA